MSKANKRTGFILRYIRGNVSKKQITLPCFTYAGGFSKCITSKSLKVKVDQNNLSFGCMLTKKYPIKFTSQVKRVGQSFTWILDLGKITICVNSFVPLHANSNNQRKITSVHITWFQSKSLTRNKYWSHCSKIGNNPKM